MAELNVRFMEFFEDYEDLIMGGLSISAPFLDIFLKDEELAELLLENNEEAMRSAEEALAKLGFFEAKFKPIFS